MNRFFKSRETYSICNNVIQPPPKEGNPAFIKTLKDLEGIILNDVSQKKTNAI